ncbi:hypothetical protein LEP3755_44590 [Leptolyngbya sp. NIES-3755]|nr:hypothetical protein LEP3755_44590 [Leptolyngbya sp. NIES-3755]
MSRAYLVTEQTSDAAILRSVLPESALESVQFVESKSDYDAESRAMSLLAEKRLPVVLVLNARTNDESTIQQRQADLGYLLRSYAGPVPFKLAIAVPELEVIFFQDRALIEDLLNRTFTDLEWQFAQRHPQELLETLPEGKAAFVERMLRLLNEEQLQEIRQIPLIQGITEFLTGLVLMSN